MSVTIHKVYPRLKKLIAAIKNMDAYDVRADQSLVDDLRFTKRGLAALARRINVGEEFADLNVRVDPGDVVKAGTVQGLGQLITKSGRRRSQGGSR